MSDISYLTDHYDEKIEKIKKINAPLNFIFYTDPHNRLSEWDCPKHPEYGPDGFDSALNAVASMQYIIDRVPNMQCVVCGGDLGCDYNDDPKLAHESIEEMMEALYKLSIPVHCCIGNHDDCVVAPFIEPEKSFPKFPGDEMKPPISEYILYPEDLHRICMKNNPTDKNYYYVDFDELGYRFVFLNTSDYDSYGVDENGKLFHPITVGLTRNQLIWFNNEAIKTDNKILVFSHSPIRIAGHYPDCQSGHEGVMNGPAMWHFMQMADNVMASFAGHLHFDNIVYDGKLVAIDTGSATALSQGMWDDACWFREFGTITETLFDVVSIKDDVIYLTRFGAGTDRIAKIIRKTSRA